ncbi:spore gernimation protein [Lactonifactor longoviformis]|uniref:Spore germination protein n=1 Tax=Lactonifactor longoviformis DSM 17459 TaxID=1122155 RepID=A0A1M5BUG4_9CLOT|nr:GerAB/ArcD/ProY family transporter [Lactonifactor longoviformis]POP33687.1 spore gernimation protein [Lactonifactor longoviformis]SHF45862.1 Spore germination protein [Lactonifactor longoviformis DSM 17459]
MFADNQKISHRQLFRQLVMSFLGIYLLCIPGWQSLEGRRGVLCVGIGLLFLFFYIIYLVRLNHSYTNLDKTFGKIGGRLIVLVYLSYLVFTGIFLLRIIGAVVARFLVTGANAAVVMGLAVVFCYLGSGQGLERRGRMAEAVFPLVTGALFLMFFLALSKVNLGYLQQSASVSWPQLGWGSYGIFCAFAPLILIPFTLGTVQKPSSAHGVIIGAVGLLGGILSLTFILLQGTFGLPGLLYKSFPMIDLMSGVNIPGDFLERVDVFWIIFLLFSVLFALGSVFFYQNELLSRVHWEKGRLFAAFLVLAGGLVCAHMGVSARYYGQILERYYIPVFLLISLIAGLRLGKNEKKAKWGKALIGILGLILLFFLNGCCGVEPENRAFPLIVSIDYTDGEYEVIYGIPDLSNTTGQGKKEESGSQEPRVTVYTGASIKEIEEEFDKSQKNYLDLGHVKTFLLGDGLMENKEAFTKCLAYLENNPAIAGSIKVFRSSQVEEAMSLNGNEIDSLGEYLIGILENKPNPDRKAQVTIQKFYNAWHNQEEFPKVPRVNVRGTQVYLE